METATQWVTVYSSRTGGECPAVHNPVQRWNDARDLHGAVHLYMSLLLLAVWTHCYHVQFPGTYVRAWSEFRYMLAGRVAFLFS